MRWYSTAGRSEVTAQCSCALSKVLCNASTGAWMNSLLSHSQNSHQAAPEMTQSSCTIPAEWFLLWPSGIFSLRDIATMSHPTDAERKKGLLCRMKELPALCSKHLPRNAHSRPTAAIRKFSHCSSVVQKHYPNSTS